MKILITGAKGFVGKNLQAFLRNYGYSTIYEVDKDTPSDIFDLYCRECDFVFHLAGSNRPSDTSEFMSGNFDATTYLLNHLEKHHNPAPILLASSIQAALDNPYGLSKKAAEELLFDYAQQTGNQIFVYRYPNIFGKCACLTTTVSSQHFVTTPLTICQ